MNIFFEIHKDIPREGPGSNEATEQAFKMIKNLPCNAKIMDIACGPGMQTIELAKLSKASILAVDMHKPFLDYLDVNIAKEGLQSQVNTQIMDMFNLDVEDESLDLIWSEGAIYIIGFERGILEWQRKLKQDGYIAVTEISWLRDDIPQEIKEYWEAEYPDIKTINKNIDIVNKAGMELISSFILPESAWWDNYYNPIIKRIEKLRIQYKNDEQANKYLDKEIEEMGMYKKYSKYYSYVFYIMKKS